MTEKRTVSYESTLSQSKPLQNTLVTPLPDGSKAVSYSHASAEEHSNRIATPNSGIVNSVGPEGDVLTSKTSVSYSLTSSQGRPLPDPKSTQIPSGSVAVSHSSTSAGEESKRASRNDIRNAKGIYRALRLIPIAERSPEQSSKLEWAKAILSKRLTSSDLTSKRQRSVEDSVSESKRQKVHNSSTHTRKDLSFSDVLKDKSILAVIDRSNVDGMISFDRWTMVSNKLQISYWTLMMENPGEPAVVEDAGWHQGRVKLVAFGDKRSCDLYKLAISRLEGLWPDAKLEVVAKEDIPCRPRARISIPAELACKDTVLKMIQFGNPSLPTHDWKVAKLEDF
ncbi:uncharacterized protein LOC129921479 [Episyrphus balteatus]|uniref:uncharacterized protein LOC129921479 n=1 Tax=Episyrphus balteatus TaxID=286459 RepID=UPI002485C696|nr:uncharacterized protein LOC129921479 [Episyrphus balteatus]